MRRILLAAIVLALVGAGCAKKTTTAKETEKPEQSPAAAPVTLSGTVNNHGTNDLSAKGATVTADIEQDNFYFNPTFIKAAPGAKVTVSLRNEGKVQHTFTIDALNVDQVVQPDKTATVTFTLPSSGVTQFHCRFHVGQGMQGAFFFTAGASAGASAAPAASSAGGGTSGY